MDLSGLVGIQGFRRPFAKMLLGEKKALKRDVEKSAYTLQAEKH